MARFLIATAGRFHADQMALALLEKGHDVRIATTLPASRFRVARGAGVTSWLDLAVRGRGPWPRDPVRREKEVISRFGRRLKRLARRLQPDVVVSWSSFGMETFLDPSRRARTVVVRDSHHIDHVDEVLRAEYARLQIPDKWPDRSFWNERERAEYAAADAILVPAPQVRLNMAARGVDAGKVHAVTLGIDLGVFTPPSDFGVTLPLRVMYFGTLSVRKAIPRVIDLARETPPSVATFTLIGPLEPECGRLIAGKVPDHVRILPAMDREQAAALLREGHVYLFPSLEEGYAQTVPQAMACGLAGIVTTATGSVECVQEGVSGFRIAPGDIGAAKERLLQLAEDPGRVALMRRRAAADAAGRPWSKYRGEVAAVLETLT